jgi:hypothetical protein
MSDGEVSLGVRLAATAHLALCRSCRQEWLAQRRLRGLTRQLPQHPVPPGLEVTIGHALTAAADGPCQASTSVGRLAGGSRTRTRFALSGAVVVAVATILLWPPPGGHGGASADIRRALASVNTWHLSGWRMVDGVRVPWEVWCRRAPFLYREQMGADVVYDDGVRRTCVLAPFASATGIVRPGISIHLPSAQDTDNVRWSYHRLVEPWHPQGGWPFVEEPDETVYSMTTQSAGAAFHRVYHVDRNTALPTRFEVLRGSLGSIDARVPEGEVWVRFDIQFDQPIPATVAAPPVVPPEYAALDGSELPAPAAGWRIGNDGGISLEVAPIGAAEDGTVAARVRGRVGRTIMAARSLPVRLVVSADGQTETQGGMRWEPDPDRFNWYEQPATDDLGRDYGTVDRRIEPAVAPRHEDSLLLLTPLEPDTPGTRRARTLNVGLRMELVVDTGFGDDMMGPERYGMRIRTQRVGVRVPAPAVAQPLAALDAKVAALWDAGPMPWARSPWYRDNLASRVCMTRYAAYRHVQWSAQAQPDWRTRRQAAARWLQRHVDACTTVYVLRHRVELAELYLQLQEPDRARRALIQVLEERRFSPAARYANTGDIGDVVARARRMLEQLDGQ